LPSSTDQDYQFVYLRNGVGVPHTVGNGVGSMYYLLWAGLSSNYGVRYGQSDFQRVMEEFVKSCNA
jgi:hypothetical protein